MLADVILVLTELVELLAELDVPDGDVSRCEGGGYVVKIFLSESCAVGRALQVGVSWKVGNRIIVAGSSDWNLAMQISEVEIWGT